MRKVWRKGKRKYLPDVLFLQLDNTTKQCKSQYLLAFCALLVEWGVFTEVVVSFLPVGHTHEDVDQLFSRIAEYLRRHDARSRDEFLEGFRAAFVNRKHPHEDKKHTGNIEQAANFSDYIKNKGILEKMNQDESRQGITNFHQFKLQKENGRVVMYVREWCAPSLSDLPFHGLNVDEFGRYLMRTTEDGQRTYIPHVVFRDGVDLEFENIFLELPPSQRRDYATPEFLKTDKKTGIVTNTYFAKTRAGVENYIRTRDIPEVHASDLRYCLDLLESNEDAYSGWDTKLYEEHIKRARESVDEEYVGMDVSLEEDIYRAHSSSHAKDSHLSNSDISDEDELDDDRFKPAAHFYERGKCYFTCIEEKPLWSFCVLKKLPWKEETADGTYWLVQVLWLNAEKLPTTKKQALGASYKLWYKDGKQGQNGWFTVAAKSLAFEVVMTRSAQSKYRITGQATRDALKDEWNNIKYHVHFDEADEDQQVGEEVTLVMKANQTKPGKPAIKVTDQSPRGPILTVQNGTPTLKKNKKRKSVPNEKSVPMLKDAFGTVHVPANKKKPKPKPKAKTWNSSSSESSDEQETQETDEDDDETEDSWRAKEPVRKQPSRRVNGDYKCGGCKGVHKRRTEDLYDYVTCPPPYAADKPNMGESSVDDCEGVRWSQREIQPSFASSFAAYKATYKPKLSSTVPSTGTVFLRHGKQATVQMALADTVNTKNDDDDLDNGSQASDDPAYMVMTSKDHIGSVTAIVQDTSSGPTHAMRALPNRNEAHIQQVKLVALAYIRNRWSTKWTKHDLCTTYGYVKYTDYKTALLDKEKPYWLSDTEIKALAMDLDVNVVMYERDASGPGRITWCMRLSVPALNNSSTAAINLLKSENHYDILNPIRHRPSSSSSSSSEETPKIMQATGTDKLFVLEICKGNGNCGWEGCARQLIQLGCLKDSDGYIPGSDAEWKLKSTYLIRKSGRSYGFGILMGLPELKEEPGEKVYWCVKVLWWDKVRLHEEWQVKEAGESVEVYASALTDVIVTMLSVLHDGRSLHCKDRYVPTVSSVAQIEATIALWK